MFQKAQKNSSQYCEEYVSTVLSLLDEEENVVSDVQKEIFEDEIKELPPIKEGQLNVSGIYAYDEGDKLEVKIYVRNGLSDKLNLKMIPFVIKNSKGDILAAQQFNLSCLGELPPHSARPIKLYFDKKNVKVDKIPQDDWEVALNGEFNVTSTVRPIYEGLPEGISDEDKLVFNKFLAELPEMEEGEFSISTFSIGIQTNGNILVTTVMRNGSNQPITINKMPMTVLDAKKRAVKSESFELKDFTVSPYRAKICNFAFPTDVHPEQDQALDGWSVAYKLVKINGKVNIKRK
ncbi:SLAP domain-containing protein [Clostridium autoethanogenum]|uniref:SLAP domain-containing protein n=1 Tax=Clostridium autoethanogenum TaxID=84023 RepID=A0A3M0S305_9CLOT|nr:SLAP domain-containing protein [Clostridium autoethanogenum]RMC92331.1 SLAP domain-containing protein [Clostridium autoethanogenum]